MQTIKLYSGKYHDVMPTDQDFENAYRMLTLPGTPIALTLVYDQVERNYRDMGIALVSDWRKRFTLERLTH